MLSRVANAIYWMSRYLERAENLARFADVTLNSTLDLPLGMEPQWEPLVLATGDEEYFKEHYQQANAASVIQFLVFDRDYPNSIVSSLQSARENARSVREAIPEEMWEQLNSFYHFVRNANPNFSSMESPSDFLCAIKERNYLINGIADATMSHDTAWNFANLGRMLERADKTSRLLDVKYFTLLPNLTDVGTPLEDLHWADVLRSVNGFQSYRTKYHEISIHRIIEFLVLDSQFPRAIQYCVSSADQSLHAISGSAPGTFSNPAEQILGQLRSELAYNHVDDIVNNGLHEFTDSLQVRLNQVGSAVSDTFFAIRPVEDASVNQAQLFAPPFGYQSQSQGEMFPYR